MVITGDLHSVLLNVWKRSIISTRQQTESLFTAGPLTHTQLHLCVRTLQLLSWILSSLFIFSPCGRGCPLLRAWVIWNWFCPLYTTPPWNTKHTVFVDMAYKKQRKKQSDQRGVREEELKIKHMSTFCCSTDGDEQYQQGCVLKKEERDHVLSLFCRI